MYDPNWLGHNKRNAYHEDLTDYPEMESPDDWDLVVELDHMETQNS